VTHFVNIFQGITLTRPSSTFWHQDEVSLNGVRLKLHAVVSLGRGGFEDGRVLIRLQHMGLHHRDRNLKERTLLYAVSVISPNPG